MSFYPQPAAIKWRSPLLYYGTLLTGAGLLSKAALANKVAMPGWAQLLAVGAFLIALFWPVVQLLVQLEKEREAPLPVHEEMAGLDQLMQAVNQMEALPYKDRLDAGTPRLGRLRAELRDTINKRQQQLSKHPFTR